MEGGSDADSRAFATGERARLFRLSLGLTADPGLAEDLVRTALVRTYAQWGRLAGQDPAGYAARVVVNANVDRWHRVRGRERLTAATPEVPGSIPRHRA